MKRFWFRVCFQKDFENREQAEEFLEDFSSEVYPCDCDLEEVKNV